MCLGLHLISCARRLILAQFLFVCVCVLVWCMCVCVGACVCMREPVEVRAQHQVLPQSHSYLFYFMCISVGCMHVCAVHVYGALRIVYRG